MNKLAAQIVIDVGISLAILVYLVAETNPNALIYARNYMMRARYKLWEWKYPTWLREAWTVRGKL